MSTVRHHAKLIDELRELENTLNSDLQLNNGVVQPTFIVMTPYYASEIVSARVTWNLIKSHIAFIVIEEIALFDEWSSFRPELEV